MDVVLSPSENLVHQHPVVGFPWVPSSDISPFLCHTNYFHVLEAVQRVHAPLSFFFWRFCYSLSPLPSLSLCLCVCVLWHTCVQAHISALPEELEASHSPRAGVIRDELPFLHSLISWLFLKSYLYITNCLFHKIIPNCGSYWSKGKTCMFMNGVEHMCPDRGGAEDIHRLAFLRHHLSFFEIKSLTGLKFPRRIVGLVTNLPATAFPSLELEGHIIMPKFLKCQFLESNQIFMFIRQTFTNWIVSPA